MGTSFSTRFSPRGKEKRYKICEKMISADAPYNKRSLRDISLHHETQSSFWYLCHRVCLTASLYAMFGFDDLEVTLFPRPALLSRPSA